MSATGKIHRTPSIPTLDGTDLNWLIEQFIADRRATNDNQKTIDTYEIRLRWFLEWWQERGPAQGWLLQAPDLVAFERHLRETVSSFNGRLPTWGYRSGILFTLRVVFHWAFNKGYTEHDYAAWIPKAHGHAPKRKAASEEALLRLFAEAGKSSKRYRTRDRAIVAVLIGMGLRRGEVANMNVEEIFFQDDCSGHAHVRGKRTSANPTGERDAAFDSATGKIIAEHIAAKRHTSGPLFRNKYDTRLTPNGVHQVVQRIIYHAKLDNEIKGCHDLRRAFATQFIRKRDDPRAADMLRRQLGHTKYSMTSEKYTLLDTEDLRQNITSPLAGLVVEAQP